MPLFINPDDISHLDYMGENYQKNETLQALNKMYDNADEIKIITEPEDNDRDYAVIIYSDEAARDAYAEKFFKRISIFKLNSHATEPTTKKEIEVYIILIPRIDAYVNQIELKLDSWPTSNWWCTIL